MMESQRNFLPITEPLWMRWWRLVRSNFLLTGSFLPAYLQAFL
jgi:hypothetical protein